MRYRWMDVQSLQKTGIVFTLVLSVSGAGLAAPNENSVAEIYACLQDGAAFVCSSKELSNVVLECVDGEGLSTFVKKEYDDVIVPLTAYTDLVDECPEGSTIGSVFVKSGSERATDSSAPSNGVGAGIFGPAMCDAEPALSCPTPDAEEDSGDEEPAGDEDPVEPQ